MKLILYYSLVFASIAAHAQYSIDWWTVDNGGGGSVGGPYTVMGTIGQPDTGTAGFQGYRVENGFWTMPYSETPIAPELKLRLESGNNLTFVWPAGSAGFTLQQTFSLKNPDWMDLPAVPVLNGDEYHLQFRAGITNSRFYRLIRK